VTNPHFAQINKYIGRSSFTHNTVYYKRDYFRPIVRPGYQNPPKKLYKLSINLRERDLFLHTDVQNFVTMHYY